jgi:hypothetical protein
MVRCITSATTGLHEISGVIASSSSATEEIAFNTPAIHHPVPGTIDDKRQPVRSVRPGTATALECEVSG